jgi:hypothetical protein
MAFLRKNEEHEVLVILNFSRETVSCSLLDGHLQGIFKNVFNKKEEEFSGLKIVELQPWEYLVYEK